jgi:hypothetical protein
MLSTQLTVALEAVLEITAEREGSQSNRLMERCSDSRDGAGVVAEPSLNEASFGAPT